LVAYHLPFVYLSPAAGDHPFTVAFTVNNGAYIDFPVVKGYFGSAEQMQVFKYSNVAAQGLVGHEVFRYRSLVCTGNPNKLFLTY
jgi:hypothetical protein